MVGKFVLGVTGPTGAGKSTVCEILRSLGVYVIDTDKIAHEVMAPGSQCLAETRAVFGSGIMNLDGTLNRKKLGNIVFSDNEALKKLSEISHKHITRIVRYELLQTKSKICAVDGAVLIGSGCDKLCDIIVSVIADPETRMARIKARDAIGDEDAKKRIDSQKSNEINI